MDRSLFEQFVTDAVAPWTVTLPDGDVDITWTVQHPCADGVCELDEIDHPVDVLLALLGEDTAEAMLSVLEPLPWSQTIHVARSLRTHFALPALPEQLWTHLVERLDLYGEAIESDLSDRGHDLLDWFRGARPWPQLARLIDRLPDGSRFRAAVADDEDLARERIETGTESGAGKALPPLEGETQDRMLLRAVLSMLLRIEHATYAVQAPPGKAGTPPAPLPGPETAEDRLRNSDADQEVEELYDITSPGWRDQNNPEDSG